ncbi:MAG: hypothetical protein HUJ26_15405 [Planctomycetaceae bacterium]|nr:hypothetical protein [Planctomycetaceae bacterium]
MTEQCDRREFARRAVFTSLALGAGSIRAEEETNETEAPDSETPEAQLVPAEDLLLDVIRQQYPSEKLTPEVLQQIRRDIAGHQYRSRVLKDVTLTNGEAPFVFTAK